MPHADRGRRACGAEEIGPDRTAGRTRPKARSRDQTAPCRAEPGRGARSRLQHHTGCRVGHGHPLGVRNQDQPPRAHTARVGTYRGKGREGRVMSQELTYEEALEKLDEQLKLLEDGNLSLEDALKAVDQARVYLKACTERLEAARKKIEVRGEPETTEQRFSPLMGKSGRRRE